MTNSLLSGTITSTNLPDLMKRLTRSTIGSDAWFASNDFVIDNYPPYNLERFLDNSYRLSFAVAGFAREDLTVTVKDNTLTIVGKREEEYAADDQFIHRGIGLRDFQRVFKLDRDVEVESSTLINGLLVIVLRRKVEENDAVEIQIG